MTGLDTSKTYYDMPATGYSDAGRTVVNAMDNIVVITIPAP